MNNLLFILTAAGTVLFQVLWIREQEGAFQRDFIFCRKNNIKYELTIGMKYIAIIGILCNALYYLICFALNLSPLKFYNILFPFAFIVLQFILWEMLACSPNFGILPSLSVVCTGIFVIYPWATDVKIDKYCGYASIVLILFDMLLGRRLYRLWMKGDFR